MIKNELEHEIDLNYSKLQLNIFILYRIVWVQWKFVH
jgi:hypothetical protein